MWNEKALLSYIKDLRTTTVPQAQGMLKRVTHERKGKGNVCAYCALGRVEEISGRGKWTRTNPGHAASYITYEPNEHTGITYPFWEETHLNPSVAEWLTGDMENFNPTCHVPAYLHYLLSEGDERRQQNAAESGDPWFDIAETEREPFDTTRLFSISELNDEYDFTFHQIAECLEYSHYYGFI